MPKRKRSTNDKESSKSKRVCNIWAPMKKLEKSEVWVSGTKVHNYLLNDPLIDWLERYYLDTCTSNRDVQEQKLKDERSKMTTLFGNGLSFEASVFEQLETRYPNKCVKITTEHTQLTQEYYEKTLAEMRKGTPIIMQAVLVDEAKHLRGIADLLIRSDYINKIFDTTQLADDEINVEAPKLGLDVHYRVIDIKWTTLHLCVNGKSIRNSGRVAAYKGQLTIYNTILGEMQGYYPNKSFILGHAWKSGEQKGDSCFDLLGHIDYCGFDSEYIKRTIAAIKWVRELHTEGHSWSINPPSRPELYPNMSNTNDLP